MEQRSGQVSAKESGMDAGYVKLLRVVLYANYIEITYILYLLVNGYPKRSPISVNFFDLGFRIKAPGDFTEAEIDDALDTLYTRSVMQERTQLIQLQYVAHGLSAVAYSSCGQCCSVDFPQDRCAQLKGIVRNYFRNDYPQDLELEIEVSPSEMVSQKIFTVTLDHSYSQVMCRMNILSLMCML